MNCSSDVSVCDHFKKRLDAAMASGDADELLNILMLTKDSHDEGLIQLNVSIKASLGKIMLQENASTKVGGTSSDEVLNNQWVDNSAGDDDDELRRMMEQPFASFQRGYEGSSLSSTNRGGCPADLNLSVLDTQPQSGVMPGIYEQYPKYMSQLSSYPCSQSSLPQTMPAHRLPLSNSNSENQYGADIESEAVADVEHTEIMSILAAVVGWVIGRSGSRIKEIQAQSGASMWIDQDVPNNEARKLFIRGSKEAVASAVALVTELMETAPVLVAGKGQEGSSSFSPHAATSGSGFSSKVFDCPADRVGLLIGRKGWVIKKIMQGSGAQVSINQSVREGADRKVIISGNQEAVDIAEGYICGILDPNNTGEFVPPVMPMSRPQSKQQRRFPDHTGPGAGTAYPRRQGQGQGQGNFIAHPGPVLGQPYVYQEDQLCSSMSTCGLFDGVQAQGQGQGQGQPLSSAAGMYSDMDGLMINYPVQMGQPVARGSNNRGSKHGQPPARGFGMRTPVGAPRPNPNPQQQVAPLACNKSNVFAEHLRLKAETVNSYPKARSVLTAAYANSNAQLIRKNTQAIHQAALQGQGKVPSAAGTPRSVQRSRDLNISDDSQVAALNIGSQPYAVSNVYAESNTNTTMRVNPSSVGDNTGGMSTPYVSTEGLLKQFHDPSPTSTVNSPLSPTSKANQRFFFPQVWL